MKTEIGTVKLGRYIGKPKAGHTKFTWSACANCKRERWVITHGTTVRDKWCQRCAVNVNMRWGKEHHAWKGGRTRWCGYWQVHLPRGHKFETMVNKKTRYVFEHRFVMATHLDRPLLRSEHVHHRNGIKTDNRLENLEIITGAEHSRLHLTGYDEGFKRGYEDGLMKAMLKIQL